jgi:hypothetical protein
MRRDKDKREVIQHQILTDLFRVLLLHSLVVHYRLVSKYIHTLDYILEPGDCDKRILFLALHGLRILELFMLR